MPITAIKANECLDAKSLLVRIIGATREESLIANFVKLNWRPRGSYRITRVSHQSYIIGFYSREDFERLATIKWEYLGNDIMLVRQWKSEESYTEDVLDSVPQKARIHNIPKTMWGGRSNWQNCELPWQPN